MIIRLCVHYHILGNHYFATSMVLLHINFSQLALMGQWEAILMARHGLEVRSLEGTFFFFRKVEFNSTSGILTSFPWLEIGLCKSPRRYIIIYIFKWTYICLLVLLIITTFYAPKSAVKVTASHEIFFQMFTGSEKPSKLLWHLKFRKESVSNRMNLKCGSILGSVGQTVPKDATKRNNLA